MTPVEIRAARERLGLSQAAIARLLDVDIVTWNRWERGRQAPRYPLMLKRALHDIKHDTDQGKA